MLLFVTSDVGAQITDETMKQTYKTKHTKNTNKTYKHKLLLQILSLLHRIFVHITVCCHFQQWICRFWIFTESESILLTKSKSEHQSPLAMLMTIYNVISRKTNIKMPTISQVYIKHHNLNSLNHFKLFPNHFISCVILFLQQWETTESGGRGRRKRWRWPSWRRTNWRRSSVWSWRRSAGLTERPSLLFASWENTPRWVATWHLTVKIMFLCRKKRICRERKIKAVLSVQCFISFRYTFHGW